MRTIEIKYAMYFQKRHNYTGRVFATCYKGVLIKDKKHFKTVRKYVLNNPVEAGLYPWKHVGNSI